jgi:biopolymer transport protein ExbB/TolQ
MARGWESKSVEQQQEEFASNKDKGKPLSSEQMAVERERNDLELSRQHILQQLQVACNPRHRQILEAALAELDRKLEKQ